jgi:hypothetical protein
MNTLALPFAAATAPDASVGAMGILYAFSFSYLGYAYFYLFPPAGDT